MPRRPADIAAETTIDLGDRTAPLVARINRRARRLIVTVDTVAGRVIVTAPSRRALPEAIDFARTRTRWISAQLVLSERAKPFRHGVVIPYRGAPTPIERAGGPREGVRYDDGRILAGGDEAHLNRRVRDWLKSEARRILTERADHYAGRLRKKRGPITIRDTRSRWGSCARNGALSFSWRLILAPPEILDYVAAHECAHLVHLNHSPAYWRVLKNLGIDARRARDWFAENGKDLYAYGVDAAA